MDNPIKKDLVVIKSKTSIYWVCKKTDDINRFSYFFYQSFYYIYLFLKITQLYFVFARYANNKLFREGTSESLF